MVVLRRRRSWLWSLRDNQLGHIFLESGWLQQVYVSFVSFSLCLSVILSLSLEQVYKCRSRLKSERSAIIFLISFIPSAFSPLALPLSFGRSVSRPTSWYQNRPSTAPPVVLRFQWHDSRLAIPTKRSKNIWNAATLFWKWNFFFPVESDRRQTTDDSLNSYFYCVFVALRPASPARFYQPTQKKRRIYGDDLPRCYFSTVRQFCPR